MARGHPEIDSLLAQYVCARVEDMRGIDLTTYDFDYDLTLAVLLTHADGSILHTYGGRDATDPQSHLSLASLRSALAQGLISHRAHRPAGQERASARAVEDLPRYQELVGRKKPTCVHCHTIHDLMTKAAQREPDWSLDQVWRWPDPIQVGLRLDRDDPMRVVEVLSNSPAEKAGLAPGDRLQGVGGVPVYTFGDVQRQLRAVPSGPTRLRIDRADPAGRLRRPVRLSAGWRRPTPKVFAWRPSKWPLSPAPGFGGKSLDAQARQAEGLGVAPWAMRVTYLVTWGDQAHRGRNAAKAGLRKGDLVLAVGGKDDFVSTDHFHAWFRLSRAVGERVEVRVWRRGRALRLTLPVVH